MYSAYLDKKRRSFQPCGFDVSPGDINSIAFDFQRDIIRLALRLGKFCGWLECGLGKSLIQLEWARLVHAHTKGNVLILAPLAVAQQFVREGKKFGVPVKYCRSQKEVEDGITVTNYEMLKHFDANLFTGVSLDESSCLKNEAGVNSKEIVAAFQGVHYKSAWSATPSPNDYMELGMQAEYLGVMTRAEMLAMYFTHDGGDTSKWRLKGHAEDKFWEWVSSWAVYVRKPSDLGYDDSAYTLPPLEMEAITVTTPIQPPEGMLFFDEAKTLSDQRHVANESLEDRCNAAAERVNGSDGQWLVWCNTNAESTLLKKLIPDAVEVKGSDTSKHKEQSAIDFQDGKIRVLISKPTIFGFGVNFQNSSKAVFVGLSHSYEILHQTLRRQWRFGQQSKVTAYFVQHELEGAIIRNVQRKEADAHRLAESMVRHMQAKNLELLKGLTRNETEYNPQVEMLIPDWLKSEVA